MITESDMGCLKINYTSDTKLPAVSDHASTLLSNHASTRLSTGLGSGTWITYTDGEAIQHLHYLPDKKLRFFSSLAFGNTNKFVLLSLPASAGEEQIDQRLTSFNSRYTFSAKEKDIETGYSYFGARYYTSDLSIWLKVDPLSDKYPSLSPYNYCANNPIKLIDPNGEDIYSINEDGNITLCEGTNSKTDYFYWGEIKRNDKGQITNKFVTVNKEKAEYKSFTKTEGTVDIPIRKNVSYSRYDFNNSKDAESIYNFIIDNDDLNGKSGAKNEWGLNIMSSNGKDFGILTSGGTPGEEAGATAVSNWFTENQSTKGLVWKSNNHNHPSSTTDPSTADTRYAASVRTLQASPIQFILNPNKKKGDLYQKAIHY